MYLKFVNVFNDIIILKLVQGFDDIDHHVDLSV